jgi:hypothetical protein
MLIIAARNNTGLISPLHIIPEYPALNNENRGVNSFDIPGLMG